jgi:putative addiction module component (TIGR02574 family)
MEMEQITCEALKLDIKERVVLAETIWESIESPLWISTEITDDEALELAKQRDDELENGKVSSLSHVELMHRLAR